MTTISLSVNGTPVAADIDPRRHLGDLVREDLLLTGTHLGCEHGVCGACTVLIDGAPARACIAFPASISGAEVTTIEGFEADPVMAEIRAAFTAEHALQCGYCTPGMLVMARDIILRLPDADAARVRRELAGNLCRCTGYVGIVAAVMRVLAARRGAAVVAGRAAIPPPPPATAAFAGTVRSGAVRPLAAAADGVPAPNPPPVRTASDLGAGPDLDAPLGAGATIIEERITVPFPRAEVWAFFQDPAKVVACIPGAALIAPPEGGRIAARMGVKLGPMTADFAGIGEMSADPATWTGQIAGSGGDRGSGSRARGRVRYALDDAPSGQGTEIALTLEYLLQGPLAQVSRGGIARDLARRLTEAFAANLASALAGKEPEAVAAPLDATALAWSSLKGFLKRLLRRGRR